MRELDRCPMQGCFSMVTQRTGRGESTEPLATVSQTLSSHDLRAGRAACAALALFAQGGMWAPPCFSGCLSFSLLQNCVCCDKIRHRKPSSRLS